jgi:hypothetical protein
MGMGKENLPQGYMIVFSYRYINNIVREMVSFTKIYISFGGGGNIQIKGLSRAPFLPH